MRIGIDVSSLPVQLAGVARYVCGLLTALSRLDKTNTYYLFLKNRDRGLFEHLGSNFNRISIPSLSRPARVLWQMAAPQKLAQRYDLDVWHSPHYLLPRGLRNVRTVVTFHDMTFFLMPELYSPAKKYFFQWMIRDAIRGADCIVATSRTTREDILKLFGEQYRNKVQQVYSGINGDFQPVRHRERLKQIRAELQAEKIVLFVGTLEKRKNLPMLLQAFRGLIHNGHPDARLVLAGQRENATSQMLKNIDALSLKDSVIYSGYFPEPQLPALYSAASLVVYPSRYEGFGFPVLEAMACGTPVLTSNNSGMKELAGNEFIQIAPNDVSAWTKKMHTVLSDAQLRRELVDYGLNRVRQFSWHDTAAKMLDIYTAEKSRGVTTPVSHPEFRGPETKPDAPLAFPALKHLSKEENAILRTLAYADIFDYPLTPAEIHSSLIATRATNSVIHAALASPELQNYMQHEGSFCFLKGKQHLMHERRERERLSDRLLLENQRILSLIRFFPFVKLTALTGANAFRNCKPQDDIDLFLIVDGKRIWSVYFALVCILKCLGKRDLICLNYLFGRKNLQIAGQNFFVAHQTAHLRALSGHEVLNDFLECNRWILNYLPQTRLEGAANGYPALQATLPAPPFHRVYSLVKQVLEKIGGLPIFDPFENLIYRLYGRHLRNRTRHLGESIKIDKEEIKLFTNDHKNHLMQKFQRRLQELQDR